MQVYVRRPSFSLCVTRCDWVPLQLLDQCDVWPIVNFQDGFFCPVKFI